MVMVIGGVAVIPGNPENDPACWVMSKQTFRLMVMLVKPAGALLMQVLALLTAEDIDELSMLIMAGSVDEIPPRVSVAEFASKTLAPVACGEKELHMLPVGGAMQPFVETVIVFPDWV